MERNNLELACNSLFIEKIKNVFKAAELDRLVKVYSFSKQRSSTPGSLSFQAAEPLIDQSADAITVAGALLIPLLWQVSVKPDEIHRYFGQKIAALIGDLNFPFVVLKTPSQGKFP